MQKVWRVAGRANFGVEGTLLVGLRGAGWSLRACHAMEANCASSTHAACFSAIVRTAIAIAAAPSVFTSVGWLAYTVLNLSTIEGSCCSA